MSVIKVCNQALSTEFCQNVINMFESSSFKQRINPDIVKLKYDCLTHPEWIPVNNMFRTCRNHFLASYFIEFPDQTVEPKCGGFEISVYSPVTSTGKLCGITGKLSFIWFLNHINVGGSITFVEDGIKKIIEPQMGRLIIFPNDIVSVDSMGTGNSSKYLAINNISSE